MADETEKAPTLDELQEQLEAARAEIEQHKTEKTQLTSRLDRLEAALIDEGTRARHESEAERTVERPARREPEPEPDFDNMSTKDLAKYVLGAVSTRITAAEERVNRAIQQLVTNTEAKALIDDVAGIITEYGEATVVEHQKAIVQIMADNPKLSAEEALALAARRAGKSLAKADASNGESRTGREPEREEGESLPPRGSTRLPAKREAVPSTMEEAGHRAWKELGLKL